MTDFESKLRLLYLLIDRIPEYVSANELGEKLNVSPRTIKRYAKSLKDIGLVDVRNGSKGGYAFDGKKSEILPFCFSGTYETILANLSIVNNSVIDRINQINVNRTKMHKEDNRGNSQDGRYWGLLKKDRFISHIQGLMKTKIN